MAARNLPPVNPRRIEALEDIGNPDATPGSHPWAVALRLDVHRALKDERSRANHLSKLLDLIRKYHGWAVLTDENGVPFRSFEAFCRADHPFGLGYDAEAINAIINERRSVEALTEKPPYLAPNTGPHTKEEKTAIAANRSNSPLTYGSENTSYLVARIARDHPKILKRMQAGEFRSIRQAALEAGILNPRVNVYLDPIKAAATLRKYFVGDDLIALRAALADDEPPESEAPRHLPLITNPNGDG